MSTAKTVTNKKTPPSSAPSAPEYDAFFTPQRIRRLVGISLIFFSILLALALLSYIFTWKEDQDKVMQFSWKILFSREASVENSLGRFGALLSHFFTFDLFGIGAYILPYFFMVIGINIALGQKIVSYLKLSLRTAFGLIVLPLIGSFFFSKSDFSVGGGMGILLYEWLSTLLGRLGLGVVLFGSIGLYIFLRFRVPFLTWYTAYKKREAEENAREAEEHRIEIEEQKARQQSYMESIIPEEKEMPTPHFVDNTYDILGENLPEEEVLLDEEELDEHQTVVDFSNEIPVPPAPARVSIPAPEPDAFELSIEATPEEEAPVKIDPRKSGHIGLDTPFDPTLDILGYQFPPLTLLDDHGDGEIKIDKEELEKNKNQIVETLLNYNIGIDKIKATIGPTVTLYEIVPKPGVRIAKIKNLEDDIALSLAALGIRIIAPIPGKGTIGIEVPNIKKSVVSMKSMLSSDKFVNAEMDLPIALGKTIANENFIADLAKMPHLLMAGATGQGKSVGLNALLVSLLYKKHPSELKFVLVDPKKVELTLFKLIEAHYLAKLPNEEEAIITDTKKVIYTLNALCIEMDQRYEMLKMASVRNIKEYNQKIRERKLNPLNGHKFLPYIVLIIDEFADLMMTAGKEVETPIARLAQLARAIGIHLVIATQRPSVNIITGVIKANFPGRMAFKVASKIDSRTILDAGGAEQLIGRGDLLLSVNGDIVRLQCPFVDTPEVERIAEFIEAQPAPQEAYLLPEFVDPNDDSRGFDEDLLGDKDSMFEEAARLIVMNQIGSTSLIQRKLKLGYNRAGRLMDQLEAAGIVGPNLGSKARDVLVSTQEELERILQTLG